MIFKVLCFLALLALVPAPPVGVGSDLKQFLKQYGYTDKLNPSEKEFRQGIEALQKFYNLPVTGKEDASLKPLLVGDRCGFPDVAPATEASSGGPAAFTAITPWSSRDLKYEIGKTSRTNMRSSDISRIIDAAFQKWEDAVTSGLSITEAGRKEASELQISFGRYEHGDGFLFDGPRGILAHAFFPEDGRIHFDSSETWTDVFTDGVNLEWVALHEIGHALGLFHSDVTSSIMFAYYNRDGTTNLDSDDVAGINALYP